MNMGGYLYYIARQSASFTVSFSLLLLLGSPLQAAEIRLPSLGGDSSASVMTPQQELLLGEAFMRSLRQQIEIIEQPEIQHYIETLGQQLVSQSDDPTAPFEFFVVRDDSINAFAGPAGKIGIHSGLIEKAESEGELAAVLAHEIAHVTQRHLMRALESRQNQSLQTAATVLATIIAASASPQAGEAMIATSAGLSLQQQINFTRSNEQEADRVGMQTLHNAEYAPKNMSAFFKRLQQASRHDGETVPEYLRTHPLSLSRIADAESRIGQYAPVSRRSDEEFQRIRTLLKIPQFTNPQSAVRHYQKALQQSSLEQQQILQFGLGIALQQAEAPKQALQQLLPLLEQQPEAPTLLIQIARSEAESGATQQALQRIREISRIYPTHRALAQFHAELLQQQRQFDPAIQRLQQTIADHPTHPALYQQLATPHTLANHPPESHLALAHYHFLRGETKVALQQLDYAERASKKTGTNFILFSSIDERRREYESKQALEKAEEKHG
jgi:predicted Zn-dependent protease